MNEPVAPKINSTSFNIVVGTNPEETLLTIHPVGWTGAEDEVRHQATVHAIDRALRTLGVEVGAMVELRFKKVGKEEG